MGPMERRKFKRKRGVDGVVTIAPGLMGWLTGATARANYTLLDIGEKGMCLVSRDPACKLVTGSKVTFEVKTRGVLGFKTEGRIAWIKPWKKGQTPLKIVGVEFEELPDDAVHSIQEFLHPPRVLRDD